MTTHGDTEVCQEHVYIGNNSTPLRDGIQCQVCSGWGDKLGDFLKIHPGHVWNCDTWKVVSIIAGIELKWYDDLFRAMPCLLALTPGMSE